MAAAKSNIVADISYHGTFSSYAVELIDANTGTVLHTFLDPATGSAGDRFGFSIGTDGTNVLIGDPTENVPEAYHAGAVYLFSLCGDGTVDPGEDCDDGNNTDGDCCSASCKVEPSTTTCRPAAGPCDLPEHCTGTSPTCPSDVLVAATVECRHVAGVCDVAEFCTGTDAACPADTFQPSTVECRAAAGECDLAETCSGVNAACPADAKKSNGTACTDDGNVCTSDSCDGTSVACQHPLLPVVCGDGKVCGTETCDPPGERTGCPAGQVCNATCIACVSTTTTATTSTASTTSTTTSTTTTSSTTRTTSTTTTTVPSGSMTTTSIAPSTSTTLPCTSARCTIDAALIPRFTGTTECSDS